MEYHICPITGKKIYVITIATKMVDGLYRLIGSCKLNNIKLNILDYKNNELQSWGQNFSIKLNSVNNVSKQVEDDSIIVFTDAFDVFYTKNITEIIKDFYDMNTRVLLSAELILSPSTGFDFQVKYYNGHQDYEYLPNIPDPKRMLNKKYVEVQGDISQYPLPYLNSGVIIGYTKDIRTLFFNHPYKNNTDDQLYWHNVYLKTNDKKMLKIDHTGKIAVCLIGYEDDVDVSKNKFIFKKTGSNPGIIHYNGLHHFKNPDKINIHFDLFFKNDEYKIKKDENIKKIVNILENNLGQPTCVNLNNDKIIENFYKKKNNKNIYLYMNIINLIIIIIIIIILIININLLFFLDKK